MSEIEFDDETPFVLMTYRNGKLCVVYDMVDYDDIPKLLHLVAYRLEKSRTLKEKNRG